MDDEDSGIFHSRAETSSNGEFSFDLTPPVSLDESLTFDETDDSDSNSPSSLSDIEGETDYSTEDEETDDEISVIPERTARPEKKRLSVTSVPSTGDPVVDIQELVPRMRISHELGERDEHWEFQDGLCSRKNTIEPMADQPNKTSPKRILKLQLSAASNTTNKSTDSPTSPGSVPSHPGSQADTESLQSADDSCLSCPEVNPKVHFELCDSNVVQCSEWNRVFGDCDDVEVCCQGILEGELNCDALVVPGNSFGFLDGEPEIQYTQKFGWLLQEDIQKIIREKHDGELLVGQAEIVPIRKTLKNSLVDAGNSGVRYAIYTPVMRVPLQVGDTVNAYLAFRAIIREVKVHNRLSCEEDTISSILCPSLCNGFGDMLPRKIALQMKTAYDAFITRKRPDIVAPSDLGSMATNHVRMTTKLTHNHD